MTDSESSYEQDSDSTTELNVPRRPRKGGKHVREEPTSLTELQAFPLAISCFQQQSCFQYCEMIARIQHHQELARLFVLHFHNGHVNLAGVIFTLTPETISQATGIPNVGEEWNKRQQLDKVFYEPYIRPSYIKHLGRVFPFQFLKDSYAPLMRLIIRYFSCEGRFTRLYAYHIRLLMHFTRVWMMKIPYFMCRNIERMTNLV